MQYSDFTEYINSLSVFEIIIMACLIVCFCKQLFYYLYFYTSIFRYNKKCKKGKINFITEKPNISVVICAKNEAHNLPNCIDSIMQQNYPNFEVVVVNDNSQDDTDDVLQILKSKYSNLRTTFIPKGSKYIDSKKMALTLGIKAAKNDLLVFTDADCVPSSNDWLNLIIRNYTPETQIILGFGAYKSEKSFVNKFILFDTLFIGIQYLNYSLCKHTYMGVGRNMAYRKSLFDNSKGFTAHLNLQSGDDDLFINEVSNKKNTRVEISKDSITFSEAKPTFKKWFRQKERHLSTSEHYKFSSKLIIGTEVISRGLFYLSLILALSLGNIISIIIASSLFLIRYIAQYIIINTTAKQLGVDKFYVGILFFDITIPIINLAIKIKSYFNGPATYKWK